MLALAREVLDDFAASRGREGEKLAAMIVDRVNAMRDIVRMVAPRIPEAQALFTDKLRQRLQDALGNASEDLILHQIKKKTTRIDVAEEISRLCTHLDDRGFTSFHGPETAHRTNARADPESRVSRPRHATKRQGRHLSTTS